MLTACTTGFSIKRLWICLRPLNLCIVIVTKTNANRKFRLVFMTSCSRTCLEKLTVPQRVNEVFAFYGTWRFSTAFTTAHHSSVTVFSQIYSVLLQCWRKSLELWNCRYRAYLLYYIYINNQQVHVNLIYIYICSHSIITPTCFGAICTIFKWL